MPRLRKRPSALRRVRPEHLGITEWLSLCCGGFRPSENLRSVEEAKKLYDDWRPLFVMVPRDKFVRGDLPPDDRPGLWSAFGHYHPGERPWIWWEIDASEPRDHSVTQSRQLERMGALSAEKRELMTDQDWDRLY